MAPLPPENTARFWLDYHTINHAHSLMWRFDADDATISVVEGDVHSFLTGLTPVLYALTVDSARFAAKGSVVSVPVAWEHAASYGTGDEPLAGGPIEIRYEGRSVGGRRGHTSLYGYKAGVPGTFRIGITPSTPLDDGLIALIGAGVHRSYLAIDEQRMNMKTYVNINFNSYWEAKQRP